MKRETAYFVRNPRTHDELLSAHLLENEQAYEVVKKITLNAIEYENFCFDMLADRQFIEDNVSLCGEGNIFICLLICGRRREDGILVVPDGTAFVKWAAYIPEVKKCGQQ